VKNLRWTFCLVVAALVALPLVACSPAEEPTAEPADETATEPMAEPEAMTMSAHAALAGADGSGISGTVSFHEEDGELHIRATVSGVEPGEHGLHIHVNGICEGDFTSAGGHFNPASVDHACPPTSPRHAGDLGNITIGADGSGTLEVVVNNATLGAAANSVVGKSMILHAGTDDCKTQPTGDAGGRLACGIIVADSAMDAMDEEPEMGAMEEGETAY